MKVWRRLGTADVKALVLRSSHVRSDDRAVYANNALVGPRTSRPKQTYSSRRARASHFSPRAHHHQTRDMSPWSSWTDFIANAAGSQGRGGVEWCSDLPGTKSG